MTAFVRDEILKLLHPFMPFVTEELWGVTAQGGPVRDNLLALTPWPQAAGVEDAAAAVEIGWVIDLVAAIRSVKAEMSIMATEIPLVLAGVVGHHGGRARPAGRTSSCGWRGCRASTSRRARPRARSSSWCRARSRPCSSRASSISPPSGRGWRRNWRAIAAEIARIDGKLANADFIKRAPEEVVEGERERRAEAQARRHKILEALERLEGAASS